MSAFTSNCTSVLNPVREAQLYSFAGLNFPFPPLSLSLLLLVLVVVVVVVVVVVTVHLRKSKWSLVC